MGRVTYQGMAQYFPAANSTILSGDTTEEIEKLKREGTGEILAHGGASFARSLVRLDLVDEYRLGVFPFLAGSGRSLFADMAKPRELELVSSTAFGNGMLGLTYRRQE